MFRTSSKWVQLTWVISAGFMRSRPLYDWNHSGLSASGVRPRQPLTHSLLPGAPPRYGFGSEECAFSPSSHSRLSQFCHFEFAPSVTSM